tara:strand:+ start:6941 stop:7360 length:420 start_codon:yes stop_codon:yes gene_type:complete
MEAFNEEAIAKEAIAASPEVTEGVEQICETEAPQQAVSVPQQAVNSEPTPDDKRNARLLTKGLKSIAKGQGGELDEDQLSAIQDVSGEAFGILSALNAPKALKIGITLGLVAIPLIPVALSARGIFKDMKDEESLDGID